MGRKIVVTAPPAGTILCGTCWVIDGDTIVIDGFHIRLAGIDAPELDHPWGKKSKWALVQLCKAQTITARLRQDLSYDRLVAECFLPDGRDLAAEMVRAGLALDWPRFSGGYYSHLEPEGVRRKLWRTTLRQSGGPEVNTVAVVIATSTDEPSISIVPALDAPAQKTAPPPGSWRSTAGVAIAPSSPPLPAPVDSPARGRPGWHLLGWFVGPALLFLIASCALSQNGDATTAGTPAPTLTSEPTPRAATFEVAAAALNVRQRPSGSSAIIGQLLEGTPIVPTAISGSWIGISLVDGRTGWVYRQYLREVSAPGLDK